MNHEHPAGKIDFNDITDGIYTAYLIRKGKSSKEAEAFIKSKRPTMHVEEVQREALQNFYRKTDSTSSPQA